MMENAQHTIVGLGEVLWDLLPGGRQFGGAPANFAYHAAVQGAQAKVVSSVGRDELGEEILHRIDAMGLSRKTVAIDDTHPTGTVSVQLDSQGKPEYIIHTDVAWDFIPQTPEILSLAERTDAVCFGSLAQRSPVSRATIRAFLAATPPECLRIFDINLRQQFYNAEIIAASLEAAEVLKLNDEELPIVGSLLALKGDEEMLLGALLEKYALTAVALTKGSQGSVLASPSGRSVHPGISAKIADTVGAGDSFTAVLATGLLHGWDLDTINDRANRVAAYVCTQSGAAPALPEELKFDTEPQGGGKK